MKKPSCYIAAIVKGVIENNDPRRHFGSLLAFKYHLWNAVGAGLVSVEYEGLVVTVTALGLSTYTEQGWHHLADSRCYFWSGFDDL